MLTLVAHVSLQDVVDAFLRNQAKEIGQTEMAKRIGTQRQGVNAIMNKRAGRRFTLEHLQRYAAASGIMTSTLLAELAKLAWEKETELMPKAPSAASSSTASAKSDATTSTVNELAVILLELLEERKRRR